MEPCPDGDTQRYFPIAFLGHIGTDVNSGTYEYKMRPELLEALKEINISGIDTFCTRLCEAEMNMKILQSVMGHSNIQTTMDIYAEATNEKKTESFKDLTTKYKLF